LWNDIGGAFVSARGSDGWGAAGAAGTDSLWNPKVASTAL